MSSEPLDLAVRGGTVVSARGRHRIDLGVRGGVVVARAAPGELGPARTSIDAQGLFVLPGIVDTHFHCRAPDHPEREDFDSGTAAAAAGGVTTIVEMPISEQVYKVIHEDKNAQLAVRDLLGRDLKREMAGLY